MYIHHTTKDRRKEDMLQNEYLKSLPTDMVMQKVKEAIEAEETMKSTRPAYNGLSWDKFQSTKMFNKTA